VTHHHLGQRLIFLTGYEAVGDCCDVAEALANWAEHELLLRVDGVLKD